VIACGALSITYRAERELEWLDGSIKVRIRPFGTGVMPVKATRKQLGPTSTSLALKSLLGLRRFVYVSQQWARGAQNKKGWPC
jgi:hypothetical protein